MNEFEGGMMLSVTFPFTTSRKCHFRCLIYHSQIHIHFSIAYDGVLESNDDLQTRGAIAIAIAIAFIQFFKTTIPQYHTG